MPRSLIFFCLLALVALFVPGCSSSPKADDTKPVESTVIVLIGHGAPPNDFPKEKFAAAMQASHSIAHMEEHAALHDGADGHTYAEEADIALAYELLRWPRTAENDPYFFGVQAIAQDLEDQAGMKVYVGFNEFCAPTTTEIIQAAIDDGAKSIIVASVMMTPGGGHSEHDIRRSVDLAKRLHPNVDIAYAWPFPTERIAGVINQQVQDTIR